MTLTYLSIYVLKVGLKVLLPYATALHITHVFGIDVIHNNHKSQVTLEAYGLTHLMCEPISYMPSFVVSLTCKIIFIRRIHLSNRLKICCRDMAMSTYTRWDSLTTGKLNLCGNNIKLSPIAYYGT